ncbi:radical SAM protein [Butyrivibrio sp. FCS006]|uniref:radical SAM protein n=1 Tax=Butyrivibrio sp. FCS006 TaxID=1280684 RepID=UPI001A981B00|nr:radical SAM protein [Butyrivibrio sp. FCS006]
MLIDVDPYAESIMRKYIGLDIPAYGCNLNCSYCYLNNKSTGEGAFPPLTHSVQYVRYKLRREAIGGSALIGMCACGETLLADKFDDLCVELLKEGHYLIIVTNGIYTERIERLIKRAGKYSRHLIFKMSFHYLELKKRNLLKIYRDNIRLIDNSDASYTIELMPHDELMEFIPEIMDYSYKSFGALPQLTVGRDEADSRKLLTALSIDEYIDVWSVFKSEMFDLKMKYYMMHGTNCNAGRDSFFIDLDSGAMRRCLFPDKQGNFYDENADLNFDRVGDSCPLEYCFNCHAYVTIGILPDFEAPTLTEIRDRTTTDNKHWLKSDVRRFLGVKIYEHVFDE